MAGAEIRALAVQGDMVQPTSMRALRAMRVIPWLLTTLPATAGVPVLLRKPSPVQPRALAPHRQHIEDLHRSEKHAAHGGGGGDQARLHIVDRRAPRDQLTVVVLAVVLFFSRRRLCAWRAVVTIATAVAAPIVITATAAAVALVTATAVAAAAAPAVRISSADSFARQRTAGARQWWRAAVPDKG
ncbi:hypothetical protein BC828DRAFT_403469 [Blastocladiella britannica]|nr:hypothetical protein BC828DRAFT_403469 [Blastocladiella britannica]